MMRRGRDMRRFLVTVSVALLWLGPSQPASGNVDDLQERVADAVRFRAGVGLPSQPALVRGMLLAGVGGESGLVTTDQEWADLQKRGELREQLQGSGLDS